MPKGWKWHLCSALLTSPWGWLRGNIPVPKFPGWVSPAGQGGTELFSKYGHTFIAPLVTGVKSQSQISPWPPGESTECSYKSKNSKGDPEGVEMSLPMGGMGTGWALRSLLAQTILGFQTTWELRLLKPPSVLSQLSLHLITFLFAAHFILLSDYTSQWRSLFAEIKKLCCT